MRDRDALLTALVDVGDCPLPHALARVDPKTVMSWIHEGKLKAVRRSARINRVPLAAVIKLLAQDSSSDRRDALIACLADYAIVLGRRWNPEW